MGIDEILRGKREEILHIAARHRAHDVRIFGSVIRGEATAESDLDVLVDFEPGTSLPVLLDLEKLLGRKVDVVTERGRRTPVHDRVLHGAVPL